MITLNIFAIKEIKKGEKEMSLSFDELLKTLRGRMVENGKAYLITMPCRETVNSLNLETGEETTFPVRDYDADSGNAHLVGTFEERATRLMIGELATAMGIELGGEL